VRLGSPRSMRHTSRMGRRIVLALVAGLAVATGCDQHCVGYGLSFTADIRGFSNTACVVTVAHAAVRFNYLVSAPAVMLPATSSPGNRSAFGACGWKPIPYGVTSAITVTDAVTISAIDGGPPFEAFRIDDCMLFQTTSASERLSLAYAFALSDSSSDLTIDISCGGAVLYSDVSENTCGTAQ